jgi:hypothetical protein
LLTKKRTGTRARPACDSILVRGRRAGGRAEPVSLIEPPAARRRAPVHVVLALLHALQRDSCVQHKKDCLREREEALRSSAASAAAAAAADISRKVKCQQLATHATHTAHADDVCGDVRLCTPAEGPSSACLSARCQPCADGALARAVQADHQHADLCECVTRRARRVVQRSIGAPWARSNQTTLERGAASP